MTDFSNNPIKRIVQNILFEDIHCKCILGLAGPNPDEYLSILKNHSDEQLLVDYSTSRDYVMQNSFVGAYDLYKNKIDMIDFDACNSIESNRIDLEYIKHKAPSILKYASFTFSLRNTKGKAGMAYTLKVLSEIFDKDITAIKVEERSYPPTRKFLHVYKCGEHQAILYRDSGDCMLTILLELKTLPEPKIEKPVKVKKSRRAVLEQRLKEYTEFVKVNKRLPTFDKEKSLYMWAYSIKRKGKHENIIKLLTKISKDLKK